MSTTRQEALAKISLLDIFIGSGRTIRNPTGYPGVSARSQQTVAPTFRAETHPQKFPFLQTSPPVRASPTKSPVKGGASVKVSSEVNAITFTEDTAKDADNKETPNVGAAEQAPKDETKKEEATKDESKKKDTIAEEAAKSDAAKDDAAKPGMKEGAKNSDGAANAAAFTPEHDAQLLSMKADNKSWKVIAEELGTPVWQLKKRFAELKKSEYAGGAEAKADKAIRGSRDNNDARSVREKDAEKAAGGGSHKGDKNGSKKKKKEEWLDKQRKQQEGQKERTKTPSSSSASLAASKVTSWLELQEDDMFSYSELQELMDILDDDMKRTWDRVASAFFNRTGRRVLPSDVRDKLGRSAGMHK